MAMTPKKLVHWALGDESMSDFGSPFTNTSSEPALPTSSLQYINSQLVARGFAPSPGLSLDGISSTDAERIVKCLWSMLNQRVVSLCSLFVYPEKANSPGQEDMSRTEELTTKFRTLSYDHERLQSMHRAAVEKAESAEREAQTCQTRLA